MSFEALSMNMEYTCEGHASGDRNRDNPAAQEFAQAKRCAVFGKPGQPAHATRIVTIFPRSAVISGCQLSEIAMLHFYD